MSTETPACSARLPTPTAGPELAYQRARLGWPSRQFRDRKPEGKVGEFPSRRSVAISSEMRELTGGISDNRTQVILQSVIDAVALNAQPLPPGVQEILQSVIDAVTLNP